MLESQVEMKKKTSRSKCLDSVAFVEIASLKRTSWPKLFFSQIWQVILQKLYLKAPLITEINYLFNKKIDLANELFSLDLIDRKSVVHTLENH